MKNSLLNILFLSTLLTLSLGLSAVADEAAPASADTAAATTTAAPADSADKQMIKGGVRGAALRTQDGLVKISQSSRQVRLSSMDLMSEVTRKDMVHVSSPNVLPNGVVINPVPSPSGMIPMGNLPARKKRVDFFMQKIGESLSLLQNEVDALIIPEDQGPQLSEKWTQVRQQLQVVQTSYASLKDLTAGDTYDNKQIGKNALNIYETMDRIQKAVKQIQKSLKS
jgi:hypothetical protein